MTQLTIHPNWRSAGFALVIAAVALGILFTGTFVSLAHLWSNSDSYGHGVFVVPISAYVLWLSRAELLAAGPRLWPLGLIGVVVCSAGWAVARALGIDVGEQLAVVGLIGLLVVTFTGLRVTWLLGFPLAYLMLAVPIWDLLVPTLQHHTAVVSAWAMRLAGVPIFLEGFYITIPSGNFQIAEVCAGLRYLMAMASIGAFYAFLNRLTVAAGIGFFALSLVWALLFNWIRVTGIIAVGHLSEMQHPMVHDHYTFGWILFAIALMPLFYAGRWFKLAPLADPRLNELSPRPSNTAVTVVTGLAVLAMVAGPLARQELIDRQNAGPFDLEWPSRPMGEWKRVSPSAALDRWSPAYNGAAWSGKADYADAAGNRVSAYAAVYGRETQGVELVNVGHVPYDAKSWTVIRDAVRTNLPQELGGRAHEILLRDNSGRASIIWYVYRSGGDFHTSPLATKIGQFRALLKGQPAGAVLAFSVAGGISADAARERLARAAASLIPAMLTVLPTEGAASSQ